MRILPYDTEKQVTATAAVLTWQCVTDMGACLQWSPACHALAGRLQMLQLACWTWCHVKQETRSGAASIRLCSSSSVYLP